MGTTHQIGENMKELIKPNKKTQDLIKTIKTHEGQEYEEIRSKPETQCDKFLSRHWPMAGVKNILAMSKCDSWDFETLETALEDLMENLVKEAFNFMENPPLNITHCPHCGNKSLRYGQDAILTHEFDENGFTDEEGTDGLDNTWLECLECGASTDSDTNYSEDLAAIMKEIEKRSEWRCMKCNQKTSDRGVWRDICEEDNTEQVCKICHCCNHKMNQEQKNQ